MQRLVTKLRSLGAQSTQSAPYLCSTRRLLHSPQPHHYHPLQSTASTQWSHGNALLRGAAAASSSFQSSFPSLGSSPFPFSLLHVRHVSSRDRSKKRRRMSPVTSKLKKIKIKPYSSYKSRFRTLNDGTIRRWREGKNHNAHLKSKKARRRLRQPSTVPVAYAKVMKKLNFSG